MSFSKTTLGTLFPLCAVLALTGCPPRNDGPDAPITPGTDAPILPGTDAPIAPGTDAPAMACSVVAPEDNLAACSDGCDNDGNTFFDCNDFSCCSSRTDCPTGTACGDSGASTVTIEQVQNRADAMHPMDGDRVTITQAGMIALTPRVLVGSATGGSSMSCRFSVWVGAEVSGEFTAVQVQELIPLGTAMNCFSVPVGRISDAFAPGDVVTSINDATYSEFCAGPMPAPSPCTDFEQSSIFLGGTATIVRGAAGTAPTGTVVPVSDLVGAAGAPGARSVALEGGLFTIENVQIGSRMDGTFAVYYAFLPAEPTVHLDIQVSNFPATACVRTSFMTAGSTPVPSITGVLAPNFGRWTLRIRDEGDVGGLTCP